MPDRLVEEGSAMAQCFPPSSGRTSRSGSPSSVAVWPISWPACALLSRVQGASCRTWCRHP